MIDGFGASIPNFAFMLSQVLGRTFVDKTSLAGNYDFSLRWTSALDTSQRAVSVPERELSPTIFAALHDRLGLNLESGKSVVDVLVIDHIERPSAN